MFNLFPTNYAQMPIFNGAYCYYNTNSPATTCSSAQSGFQRFCPCSSILLPAMMPSVSPTGSSFFPTVAPSMKPTAVSSLSSTLPSCSPSLLQQPSKIWILGASGASCDTACSKYKSGSVCSPDALGSTYGWFDFSTIDPNFAIDFPIITVVGLPHLPIIRILKQ